MFNTKLKQECAQQARHIAQQQAVLAAIDRSSAVIEFTPDGIIQTANANFLNTVGFTLAEIQGQHHRIFCEESYANSAEYREFWSKLNRGEFVAGLFRRVRHNGETLWLEASYNPIFDVDGKLLKVGSSPPT